MNLMDREAANSSVGIREENENGEMQNRDRDSGPNGIMRPVQETGSKTKQQTIDSRTSNTD